MITYFLFDGEKRMWIRSRWNLEIHDWLDFLIIHKYHDDYIINS